MLKKIIANKTILNILLVAVITLVVKLVAFYKEMRIGSSLGLSMILDTFLIAALVPGFINNVFASSFQNVFIPNYINELKDSTRIRGFRTASILLSLGLACLLSLLAFIFSDLLLENIYPGKSSPYYELIRIQSLILIPCITFWSISSIISGMLEAQGLFKFSSVYSVLTSLSMIICLLYNEKLGSATLALGMTIGSAAELLFLILVARKHNVLSLSKPDFRMDSVKILSRQFPIKAASSLLTGSTSFVTQFFAAELTVGSIGAINYGTKIPSLITVIVTTAIGSVSLPYFSKLIMTDRPKAYQSLNKAMIYVFLITSVMSFSVYLFSNMIIEILFQRGSFTATDTLKVASIQQILIFYIPFYSCNILIIKFLTSINKNTFMLYASIVNLVLNILLSKYLVVRFDIQGLAFSNLAMNIVNFFVLFIFLRGQFEQDRVK